jgi:putative heme-binding domain-containing protein
MSKLLSKLMLEGDANRQLVEQLVQAIAGQDSGLQKTSLLVSLPSKPLLRDEALVNELVAQLISDSTSQPDLGSDGDRNSSPWKVLRRLILNQQDLTNLLEAMPNFNPREMLELAELVSLQANDDWDVQLLQRLAGHKAARAIPTASLQNLYRNRSSQVKEAAKVTAQALSQSDPETIRSIQSLLDSLPKGDSVRGLTLYHGSKAGCGGCHQMGYLGGKIGPELSRIGSSRTREALLEAIVMPSQRIEQGYDTLAVLTVDGRLVNGLVVSRDADQIQLRVSADKVETIPTVEIESQRPSSVSIMPGGMLDLLSRQELADLLSLLEASK